VTVSSSSSSSSTQKPTAKPSLSAPRTWPAPQRKLPRARTEEISLAQLEALGGRYLSESTPTEPQPPPMLETPKPWQLTPMLDMVYTLAFLSACVFATIGIVVGAWWWWRMSRGL